MFSLITIFLSFIQKSKQRLQSVSRRGKDMYNNLKKKGGTSDSESEKITRKKEEKTTIGDIFLKCFTFIFVFLDSVPVIVTVICSLIIMLFLAMAVGVMLSFTSFISSIVNENTIFDAPTTGGGGGTTLTTLNWSEEELAQYGANLSEYEKNLYRMGIAMKKAHVGYDGQKGFDYANDDMAILFMIGTDSTETGLRFFNSSKNQKDILQYPSDIKENGLGYGYLGLHRNEGMDSLVNSGDKTLRVRASQRDGAKQAYKPVETPSTQIRYTPWGAVSMAAKWNNKYHGIVNTKDRANGNMVARDKIEKVLNEWGVQNNREQLIQFIELCLVQAQFHGATKKEHEAYAHFITAFYCATSDNDAERSLDKWGLVGGGYSESSTRKSMLGLSGNFRTVGTYTTPASLPQGVGTIEWELNGQKIGKPLWTFLWEKFNGRSGMQVAWNQVKAFGNSSGGVRDRVLNFHYGLNSYYQAKKIVSELCAKMGIQPNQVENGGNGGSVIPGNPGEFKNTPGVGQARLGGKSTEQWISEWKGSAKSYLQSLVSHFGQSTGTGAGTDKVYGVPFYGQGARFGESFGKLGWYSGADTYNRSGCMVYAMSYAISAMTGQLINPPETGALMIMNGALGGSGARMSNWTPFVKKLGLNSTTKGPHVTGAISKQAYFDEIDMAIDKGGVAIIRESGKPYAAGSNHYMVVTGKVMQGGAKYYTIYTSTSKEHSTSLHTQAQLSAKIHREVVTVWR